MGQVQHIIDALPESNHVIRLKRDEALLLTTPDASAAPMKMWQDYEPLVATHFAQKWQPGKFAPPRDVYSGEHLRLEWQQMEGRQPFYHRNADVEEISYQVDGDRTLMTELGTIELRAGDYSRIPVGIAHDNYGRREIHLLMYIVAPATEAGKVSAEAEVKEVPFEGWTSKPRTIEMMTECLGAFGCDLAVSLSDERLLLGAGLEKTESDTQRLVAQRASTKDSGPEWLYKSVHVWMGHVNQTKADGTIYHTHRRATAIEYQISGERTLITQRGTIQLVPGDFIQIPVGCAYTTIHGEESKHIILLTTDRKVVLKVPPSKKADPTDPERVAKLRRTER